MKATNLIYYAIALFYPIIHFTVLTNNSNERNPLAVWIMCILLGAGAGLFASKGFIWKGRLKWVICSALVGAALAFGLTVGV